MKAAQSVTDADKDAVERIDDTQRRHGILTEIRHPETVDDVVQVLDEESYGYRQCKSEHTLPLIAQ